MAKKNLRKIPQVVLTRLRSFDQDDVVVACAKSLKPGDVKNYVHLGLRIEDGELIVPNRSTPSPDRGRYSRANVEGLEIKRKDLPKVTKTYMFERPNWGDSSKGYHTISWDREVYRVDFYPPKEVELSVTLVEQRNGSYILKFAVDQVISRRTENFEQELLYNLNLLQESVGSVDVFESEMSLEDYAKTIHVDWEILPPGTVDEVVQKMLAGKRPITDQQRSVMEERVSLMLTLEPEQFVAGTDGFLRYFGAKFGEELVAFENVNYGNAMYVMYQSWQELSKKSRMELLAGPRDSFDRIEHRTGWQKRFVELIKIHKERNKQG